MEDSVGNKIERESVGLGGKKLSGSSDINPAHGHGLSKTKH